MSILRVSIGLVLLGALMSSINGIKLEHSNALAATAATENVQARDAATSRDDINLTNICIDAGQSKTHCLCVTKIFKHEMSLRQYKAATRLYASMVSSEPAARNATNMRLKQLGYIDTEIKIVDTLQRTLSNETKFHDRCALADAYFNQTLN